MDQQHKTYFSVDSRLLFQLGEKLVTDRAVALAELVKNSYDADATRVVVRMQHTKSEDGTIVVEDNGTGMALSAFEQSWMRIATIDKEENPISVKYKRKKAGEKGIGRFACRRLSAILELESVAENENGVKEKLQAQFTWSDFTPGSDVNVIPVVYTTSPVDAETPTGTILTLKNTIESWNAMDIKRLRVELMDLISPLTYKSDLDIQPETHDPGFIVKLECSEFPMQIDSLDSTFFKNAWAKLSASVDSKGFATYNLQTTKGIKHYAVDKTITRSEAFEYLRDTQMEAYLFSYRTDFFQRSEWKLRKTQDMGTERGGIRVYADNFRVFGYGGKADDWLATDYDRARSLVTLDKEVAQYVEEGKRPGLMLFRSNNVFGHVVFSRETNKHLEVTVNRERIIDNEAFQELRKFARLGIDFATVIYANAIAKEHKEGEERLRTHREAIARRAEEEKRKAELAKQQAEEKARRAEEERRLAENEASQAANEAEQASYERRIIESKRRETEEERRALEEAARSAKNPHLKEQLKSLLEREKVLLAAEETAIIEEEKAIRRLSEARSKAAGERATADSESYKAEEERKKAQEASRKAEEESLRIRQEKFNKEYLLLRVLASTGTLVLIFGHEIQSLIDDMEEMSSTSLSLLPHMSEKERASYEIVLESFSNRTEMVKELGEFLGLIMGAQSRTEKKDWVVHPIVDNVFRPFKWYLEQSQIEYENTVPTDLRTPRMYRSELVSVLHNLMTNAAKAVRGEHTRRIEITGFIDDDTIHIQFLDTGKGLDKSRWEVVFEPFESDSEPDMKFGAGTGLGLKIVRDIIRSYGGEVQFCEPPEGWKTCVDVMLPREE